MALRVGELYATLRLDDAQYRQRLQSAQQQITSTGDRAVDAGKQMTTGLTMPLVGMAAGVLKVSGDFEAGMNGVRAVTGATGKDFEDLRGLAKEMGATTQFSATDAAGAMEFLGMTGWKAKDIMSGLPDVLNLAAAGNTELATTADIASNIMAGFGIEATDTARVADVLAKTMATANVDLEMLGESMKYCAPLAKSAGWSLEETAAAVGFLGNVGIQGSAAGTGLNSMLATLADTSSTGGRKLKEFGVAATDSNGKVRPLTDIIADLADKGADVADVIGIFGLEAGPKMQALLGQGSEGLKKMIGDLQDSEGAAKKMADIRMEGFNGSVKGLKSAVEGLMIAIGDSGLLKWAGALVDKLTGLVSWLTQTDSSTLKVATAVGLALAVLGPLLIIVGKTIALFGSSVTAIAGFARGTATAAQAVGGMARSAGQYAARMGAAAAQAVAAGARMTVSAVATSARVVAGWVVMGAQAVAQGARMAAAWLLAMGPIPLIIAAVVGLVTLIVVYWDEIQEATRAAWDWIWGKIQGAVDFIIGLFSNFSLPGLIAKHWKSIREGASRAWNGLVDWLAAIPGRVLGLFSGWSISSLISGHFQRAKDGAKAKTSELVTWVRGIPGKIGSAVGNLGRLLYNKGMDVIRGLWNGIKSMGAWLGQKIAEFATSWIPGPVAKALGIRSPSRVMADSVGRWIPAGIVDGVEAGRGALDRTMRNLVQPPTVPDMAPAYAGASPYGGRSRPAQPTVSIEHWHAAENGTPDDNARALAWLAKARG
ncbi:phage tail tape measure protein [Streptomyces diastaticus]|uniref:phage tail tape measure protein n=1 Tax=Streptomyces diastaticus TaxID=1956 RepID=UPI003D178BDB